MTTTVKHLRTTYWTAMSLAFVGAAGLIVGVACGLLHVPVHPFVGAFLLSALVLVLFTIVAATYYFRILDKSPKGVTRYYMIQMLARFVVCGGPLVVCHVAMTSGAREVMFAFLALFLVTLVCESVMYIFIEKKLNEKQND